MVSNDSNPIKPIIHCDRVMKLIEIGVIPRPKSKWSNSRTLRRRRDRKMDDRRGVHALRVSYSDCTAALACPLTSSPTPPSQQQQPQPSNGTPRSRDLGPILVGSGGGGWSG
ncbi:unnamed protein product [Macrosiphum euphorbiae]|uniref:Uncharacterized protein n=1 Tax=Macrosiphum euphorbiae TaxID=13131 RepID=A0AAV0VQV8_9HEMI|nr:unnamed protein product [Macrosiphum euphorbiae]